MAWTKEALEHACLYNFGMLVDGGFYIVGDTSPFVGHTIIVATLSRLAEDGNGQAARMLAEALRRRMTK